MKKILLLCFALLVLGFAAVPTSAAPEGLSAAGCCPVLCSVNRDCDAKCGAGLGRCVGGSTCCRVCLCSLGGT